MTLAHSPVTASRQPSSGPAPPVVAGDREASRAYPLQRGVLPLLRADGAIQLGSDPVHGVVLTGLTTGEAAAGIRALQTLAGATGPVEVQHLADCSGLSATRTREVVATVEAAGLTASAGPRPRTDTLAAWALARRHSGRETPLAGRRHTDLTERRGGARVVVDGRGNLVEAIGGGLRNAQVGTVRTGWYAAASEDLDGHSPDPSLVVTVGTRLPQSRAEDWRSRGIAVLPVVARTGSVDIGPLMVAGGGPCVHCVILTEGRPLPTARPTADHVADGQGDLATVEPSLAGIAAGAIVMLTLGVVDAYPPPLGIRWHTALPLPSLATSRWTIHPGCSWAGHPRTLAARGESLGRRAIDRR